MAKDLSNNSTNIDNGDKPKRDAKGRLLPGQKPLNPLGKPKGTKHFSTIFNEILNEEITLKDGTKMKVGKAMAWAMARKAIRGSEHAFDSVADRMDGRPKNEIDLEVTENPVPILPIKRKK